MNLLSRRMVLMSAIGKTLLPKEYQQVEYLESTGTQYIDTGLIPNQDTKVYAKFKLTEVASNFVFGARYASQQRACYVAGATGPWSLRWGARPIRSYGTTDTNLHEITMGKDGVYWDGVLLENPADTEFTCPNNFYIFASYNNGTVAYGKTHIYTLKLWDNDTLIREYIPCYRKNDNEIGLYDMVENKFYTNQGTGEFLIGGEV